MTESAAAQPAALADPPDREQIDLRLLPAAVVVWFFAYLLTRIGTRVATCVLIAIPLVAMSIGLRAMTRKRHPLAFRRVGATVTMPARSGHPAARVGQRIMIGGAVAAVALSASTQVLIR